MATSSTSSSTAAVAAAAVPAAAVAWEEQVYHFKDAKDVFLGHKQLINSMLLVPQQGRLYTAGLDGRIIAYDTHDRSKAEEFRGATMVSSLVLDDGNILCCMGKLVHIVKPGSAALFPLTRDVEPSSEATAVCAQGGDIYVGHADGSVRWWRQGECRKQWFGKHVGAVGEIALSATAKKFYTTSADGSALCWQRESVRFLYCGRMLLFLVACCVTKFFLFRACRALAQ